MNLSQTQLDAIKGNRLHLLVVPLDPQPNPKTDEPNVEGGAVVFTEKTCSTIDIVALPHTIGDRIETPHGVLIVTGLEVARLIDMISLDLAKTGLVSLADWENRAVYAVTQFRYHFAAQHGPDVWDNNPWCAFVTVKKEQNDE